MAAWGTRGFPKDTLIFHRAGGNLRMGKVKCDWLGLYHEGADRKLVVETSVHRELGSLNLHT